jgi:hypothetical protein
MTKGAVLVATVLTLVVGCDRAPDVEFRVSRGEAKQVEEIPVNEFLPLVSATTVTPTCEDLRTLPAELGARALSLIYGDPARRRVTAFLDDDGNPVSYSDSRGDLITSDDHVGDFTAISLDLAGGQAFATNRPALGAATTVRLPYDDALVSERLGEPSVMLALVLETCG